MSLTSPRHRGGAALPAVRRRLARLLARGGGHAQAGGVDIVLIGDGEIAALAGRFRGSPHPTDVLAFRYRDGPLRGEIAISLPTAARQARERGVPLAHELTLLCVHGLLHLEGQGDETYRDWCEMRIREFETLIRIL